MKKKTLAAASLLLALLMPLGATPLAVYADEAQMGISTVGEAPPENGNSIAPTVSDGKAFVASKNKEYESLDEAMDAAVNGDSIYLGAGVYCGNAANPTQEGKGAGKSLTFVGAGTDKTTWQIKAPATQYGGDGWCDYSFKNSDSITFESMTVIGSVYTDNTIQSNNTQGLTYINNITLKNCIFNGRADYWGYQTTTFENVIFNAPGTEASGIDTTDYCLWTWTGTSYTFKSCTFNSNGKIINAYREKPGPVIINFQDCNVFNTKPNKQVLNIKDHTIDYIVNISGINTVNNVNPNSTTCSRLFQVESVGDNNQHYATVSIDGTTVWQNGQMVSHSIDTTNDKYTDGYKDNAFDITNVTEWTLKADTTSTYVRTITKQCQYCHENIVEQEEKAGYCLRYDLNGGTGAEGTYNDTYYPPQDGNTATVAADPSRAGYQFAGWQDEGGNPYAAGNAVIVDHNITLTAQWNKLVTVSFDLCGHGGANIPSQTFVSGNKASEPTAPKEDGWVFGGWYTEKGCQYRFSFDSAVTSDITLYAKWDRVTTVVSAPVATPTPSPAPVATPTPSPAAAATKTATVKNAAIPQTSDVFPMEGLLALLAVGAVGFGAAGWLRKKHH